MNGNRFSLGTFIVTFLLVIFSSSIFVFPVKADAQVEILTHSSYIDSFGYYNIVGEVQNVGDQPVEWVRIQVTFYDSSDTVVDTTSSYSNLDVILPNRKSPFDIFLFDVDQSSKVHHYTLSVSFSSTVSMQQSLRIVSHSSYLDVFGDLNIVGEVENTATGGATYVNVIATCYDEFGTVINVGSSYTSPSDIEAGQKAPFDIFIYDNNPELVASYELTVESSEFAAIPEFSSLVILSTFIIATIAVIIVTRRKEQH